MLAASLACAPGADQDVHAFISDFRWSIDADEDEAHLREALVKGWDGTQQHAAAQGRPHSDLELTVGGGVGPEALDGLLEFAQKSCALSVEALAFACGLQSARGPREKQDPEILF